MNRIIDAEGYTNVYVDGSWLSAGSPGSAAGYGIFWGPSDPNNRKGQSPSNATNNVAEIQAATIAIKQAGQLGIRKLRVNTDSEVLYMAATQYIPKWKQNNWMSLYNIYSPIKNRRNFEDLDIAMRSYPQMDIKFRHIPGHSGNQYHNAADRLARAGAELHQY
ncbi:ribonuclease H1-like [Contarinia nasturtii]|uniref:ribonuclease H1-like n=1 Tax=Contarinia nasturtii TaxID=265458 RepID=UPI0012D3F9C3|nr:ribonuclease H1-like [Contarinia nasturtii]